MQLTRRRLIAGMIMPGMLIATLTPLFLIGEGISEAGVQAYVVEKCPHCKIVVQADWKFCRGCGANLTKSRARNEPGHPGPMDRYRLSTTNDDSDRWGVGATVTTIGTKGYCGTSFGIVDRTTKSGVYEYWLGHTFEIKRISESSLIAEGNGWESIRLGGNRGNTGVTGKIRMEFTMNELGRDTIKITFVPQSRHRYANLAIRTQTVQLKGSSLKLEHR